MAQRQIQDRSVRVGSREVNPDALLQLLDSSTDFDQAQPDGVDLSAAPGRALGQAGLERPDQPIGRGMQEQAELIGGGRAAGGAVGRQVPLVGFDVVFHLAARAVAPLVQALGPTGRDVGDDEADIDLPPIRRFFRTLRGSTFLL